MAGPVTAPLRLCVRRQEIPLGTSPDRRIEISVRVPSDLTVVEEVVDLIARHGLASGLAPRTARFHLRVVVAEALANAIVYGNRLDPEKGVDLRVVVTPQQLSVHVRDEGEGFDPGRIPDPTMQDRVELADGRGLFLIRQLVDEVQFNDRGNSICMIMRRA